MNRAVFLDRDGVLNALVYRPAEGIWDSPYSLEEFKLVPGAAEAVRVIKELGFLAIVVSNQPGSRATARSTMSGPWRCSIPRRRLPSCSGKPDSPASPARPRPAASSPAIGRSRPERGARPPPLVFGR